MTIRERLIEATVGKGEKTLVEISLEIKASSATVSARIRDLRKEGYGVRRRVAGWDHFYTITAPGAAP